MVAAKKHKSIRAIVITDKMSPISNFQVMAFL